MSAGGISGSSPCRLTTMSLPAQCCPRATSAIRSVPDAWLVAVITALAPKARALSRMRASSVAVIISAAPAARAPSYTHCSSGFPARGSKALPGRRTEPKRAGITTRNTRPSAQRSSSGSSAASWRASSSSITGTSSRIGNARRSVRHTNTCVSRRYLSVPLHTGQARISSIRESMATLPSEHMLEHASAQPAPIRLTERGANRQIPHPCVGERGAFYGILLRHQHRQVVREVKLARRERMMIREGMRDHFDPLRAQLAEEAPGIADSGDRVYPPPAKGAELGGVGAPVEPDRRLRNELHAQRAFRQGLADERPMDRIAVDDHDVGPPERAGGLA